MTLGGDADQEATVLRGADEQLLVDHQAPAAEHRHLPEKRLVGEQVPEASEERSLCGGHSRVKPWGVVYRSSRWGVDQALMAPTGSGLVTSSWSVAVMSARRALARTSRPR